MTRKTGTGGFPCPCPTAPANPVFPHGGNKTTVTRSRWNIYHSEKV